MSRFSIGRLLAPDLIRPFSKSLRPTASAPQWTRLFSQSPAARNTWNPSTNPPPGASGAAMDRLVKNVIGKAAHPAINEAEPLADQLGVTEEQSEEPYHFHIYSHKHNTHITVTKPNRDALISLSCGNIGFRKSNRKHYDSAYQLGAYVIDKMHQKGLVRKIHKLEVVLRGFGPGREAVVKVLMGNEGKMLRPKIVRVSDSTRLKFGGTRSKKKRRLG
ncbi:28S ribosomal protein S18b, mitochondrial [Madurella fahalii]|uniref:28S ribosomal protein S18b, mitochondrial n=1 Tax=Madurella fahalii TaxID=1157608 RepID=A0ABQ0FX21_9PEZI